MKERRNPVIKYMSETLCELTKNAKVHQAVTVKAL